VTGTGSVVLSENATLTGTTTTNALTVNGDLFVTGSNFTSHAQTVTVSDNLLVLNSGEVGTGVAAGTAGLRIDRGTGVTAYEMVFDEATDMFRVGMEGDMETLASQPYVTSALKSNALNPGCNLSDIPNAAFARSNLGITSTSDAGSITSGTLAVLRGGTGTTTATGTGSVVLSAGATLTGTTTVATLAATTVSASLVQFPNTMLDKKLVLWDSGVGGAAFYGLGIQASTLKYNVESAGTSHVFTASNVELMRVRGDGNVGIGISAPTEKLHVTGNILATGNVSAQSDARLKTDVALIDNAMARIGAISGYTYRMKSDETGRRCLGVLAQEVLAVMPEAVTTPPAGSPDGYMSVAYGNLTALLIEGIKELGASVKDVSERLARLEASSA